MIVTMECILDRLDKMVPRDGGVRPSEDAPPDALTTSQVLVLATEVDAVAELLGDRLEAAVDYLCQDQQADGRWLREKDDWHTSITAWNLLALQRLQVGPKWERAVRKGSAWLRARQTADGGFSQSDVVLRPNTYSTSYSTAASFACDPSDDAVRRGLNWLANAQSSDGGFSDDCTVEEGTDPSLTAYVAHAISSLPSEETALVREGCERYIARTQRPSGAWPAWYENVDSVEGTAAALRVLLASDNDPGPAAQAALAFLDEAVERSAPEHWIIITLAYVAARRTSA
ncbi:prenyltransferase/squalene oxidase repeat-containing protein [Micromonospora zamorensis]|uniref:prenyltransferase/squalene oxidase repeat-containing protein n=1 Tax=Micromonospora zamorensis TaxID=709883 RepID=UPI0033FB1D82